MFILRLSAQILRIHSRVRLLGIKSTWRMLGGESRGMLRHLENWTPVSVGAISMGQEVGVTPLQMITAVSAMANGGLIVSHSFVREQRHGNQETESQERNDRASRHQGDDGGVYVAHAGRRCVYGHWQAGQAGWLHFGGKNRDRAKIRSGHGALLDTRLDRLFRRIRPNQFACCHDPRATRFAGWGARRRPSRRARV